MARVAEKVTRILEPHLGRVAADTVVRTAALSLGKTADSLEFTDADALGASAKRALEYVTSTSNAEAIAAEIKREIEGM